MVLGLNICELVYKEHGFDLEVLSVTDGEHVPNSRHYVGLCVDLDVKRIPTTQQKEIILKDIQKALGFNFRCILNQFYIHIAYEPKKF